MTEELFVITGKERDSFIAVMQNNMQDPDAYDAITELQSLPKVEGEPVAWTWDTMGSGGMSGYRMAHFQMNKPEKTATMFDLIPLYTYPLPSQTQISADDVTDEMVKTFENTSIFNPNKYAIAAAVNAWLKHGGGK